MIKPEKESYNQWIDFEQRGIKICIKREDVLHSEISGNKFRKLKYNLLEAHKLQKKLIVSFGGAYSNHIAAVAAAGRDYGFKSLGIIRGEELSQKFMTNPTLQKAYENGMNLEFISRAQYRDKYNSDFLNFLTNKYGDFYLIPEGGTNELAIKGCEEILTPEDSIFNYICLACGTAGTISGIIRSAKNHQKILGFPALKGIFLEDVIKNYTNKNNWQLIHNYNFGGYAKVTSELKHFIKEFQEKYNIVLEPIYTGKMLYGVFDLIQKGFFEDNSKILVIHTGGLQGLASGILNIE